MRCGGLFLALMLSICALPRVAPAQTGSPPTIDDSADVVAFLSQLYGRLIASESWIGRSLGLISLARLPGETITDTLLKSLKDDPVPAVRMVAWQCILSRAEHLSGVQFRQWREATSLLVKRGAFRGETRVGLIRLLAVGIPTASAKRMWVELFEQTSSLQNQDIPVLDALGDCLKTWRSPDLVQYLLERLFSTDDAHRAEFVLHRVGCDAPWAGQKSDEGHNLMWQAAIQQYAQWWRKHRGDWVEILYTPDDPWKDLRPQFVPAIDWNERISRYDKRWSREMELAPPALKSFDIVFVVDATGSMRWVLDYLKGDVARVLGTARLISPSARVGITFYRDHGDAFVTRSVRLTNNVPELQMALNNMDARGGGDVPEAVYEALFEALSSNPWKWGKDTRRAVVLIGDAPPQPQTQQACESIAAQCAEKGVKLYLVKASKAELPAFDALAAAAKQQAMTIDDSARSFWPFPQPRLNGNAWYTRFASGSTEQSADRQIITSLLTDAISEDFRDRVVPLVGILLALTSEHTPEKRDVFGVATEPDRNRAPVDPQAR